MAEARLSESAGRQRIVWLDVLRGAALFGIAQINFPSFAAGQLPMSSIYGEHASYIEQSLYALIMLLISAKFYPVFAFLFGYGHALQRERLARQGLEVRAILMRRYGALLLFGVFHGSLLFFGDILTLYAIAGIVLLADSGANGPGSRAALLRWALVSLVIIVIYSLSLPEFPASIHADWVRMHADDLAILARGDGRSILTSRATLYGTSLLEQMVTFLPELMLFMNAGIWACERGVLQQPELHRNLFRRCAAIGLGVGVPVNLALMLCELNILDQRAAPVGLSTLLDNLAFLMSLGWLGLLGLYASRRGQGNSLPVVLILVAALGRVALTNYVVQSLVMMAAWYLFWRQITILGAPFTMAALAFTVCLLQMLWANRQVRAGRQGPFEAAWRRITYARAAGSIAN